MSRAAERMKYKQINKSRVLEKQDDAGTQKQRWRGERVGLSKEALRGGHPSGNRSPVLPETSRRILGVQGREGCRAARVQGPRGP